MFSLIDYIEDKKTIFNNSKFEIERKIKKEIGFEGNIIMDYMRELRNSIIHRGEDVVSAGNVINGRFAILAPDNVTNRSGNLIEKPKDMFLDKLLSILDNATKNVTKSELHRLNVLEESNVQSINDLAIRIKNIPIPHHAPDEVKMMIKAHQEKLPDVFSFFGRGTVLGIQVPILIMLGVYVLAWLMLNQLPFGRYVYAMGGNEEAARLSGIRVPRYKMLVYVISGLTAALAGLVLTSRLMSGQPNAGEGFELDAIAAVVLGGAAISGGRGAIVGTLVGAMMLGVLNNGLNLMNVSPYIQNVVKGGIILAAIYLSSVRRK